MLKPVKPRGDTSVAFLRLGCTSASWQTSATEYTVRPESNNPGPQLLKLSTLQMCSICNAGTLLASVKARINLTDCCLVIMTRLVN